MERGSAAGARSRFLRQTHLLTEALPAPRVPGSSVAASESNVRGPGGALSLGTALPSPGRARAPSAPEGPLGAGEPPGVLEPRAPCRDGPLIPVTPAPQGRSSSGSGGASPAGTGQRRHRLSPHSASAPAQRVMSPSSRGCWHMLARGKRALASTLCTGSADVELPQPAASQLPAPPKGISEPGGLLHLRSGRQQRPTAQQTACQEPAHSVPVPSPAPGPWDPFLKASTGFGAGRASPGHSSLDNQQH